jgi:hypothetical protein
MRFLSSAQTFTAAWSWQVTIWPASVAHLYKKETSVAQIFKCYIPIARDSFAFASLPFLAFMFNRSSLCLGSWSMSILDFLGATASRSSPTNSCMQLFWDLLCRAPGDAGDFAVRAVQHNGRPMRLVHLCATSALMSAHMRNRARPVLCTPAL